MLEIYNKIDSKPAEEIVQKYPEGIFLYNQPPNLSDNRTKGILEESLPGYLIVVTNLPCIFPADMAYQSGSNVYVRHTSLQLILNSIGARLPGDALNLRDILPLIHLSQNRFVHEGGNHVKVGGADELIVGGNKFALSATEMVKMTNNDTVIRRCHGLFRALQKKRAQGLYSDIDWLYEAEHIDLVMTGFRDLRPSNLQVDPVNYYIDDQLLRHTKRRGLVDDFLLKAHELSSEFTHKGGCNIQFMDTKYGWLAFVPSKGALGPISDQLTAFGYQIIELGDDQVAEGGGIKCRSLEIKWKNRSF